MLGIAAHEVERRLDVVAQGVQLHRHWPGGRSGGGSACRGGGRCVTQPKQQGSRPVSDAPKGPACGHCAAEAVGIRKVENGRRQDRARKVRLQQVCGAVLLERARA